MGPYLEEAKGPVHLDGSNTHPGLHLVTRELTSLLGREEAPRRLTLGLSSPSRTVTTAQCLTWLLPCCFRKAMSCQRLNFGRLGIKTCRYKNTCSPSPITETSTLRFFSRKPDELASRGSQQPVAKMTLDGVRDPGQQAHSNPHHSLLP